MNTAEKLESLYCVRKFNKIEYKTYSGKLDVIVRRMEYNSTVLYFYLKHSEFTKLPHFHVFVRCLKKEAVTVFTNYLEQHITSEQHLKRVIGIFFVLDSMDVSNTLIHNCFYYYLLPEIKKYAKFNYSIKVFTALISKKIIKCENILKYYLKDAITNQYQADSIKIITYLSTKYKVLIKDTVIIFINTPIHVKYTAMHDIILFLGSKQTLNHILQSPELYESVYGFLYDVSRKSISKSNQTASSLLLYKMFIKSPDNFKICVENINYKRYINK